MFKITTVLRRFLIGLDHIGLRNLDPEKVSKTQLVYKELTDDTRSISSLLKSLYIGKWSEVLVYVCRVVS